MATIIIGLVLAALIGVGLFFYLRGEVRRRLFSSLDSTLYEIRLPVESREGKTVEAELARFEQFLASLASLGESFTFEVAVPFIGREIKFFAAVSNRFGETFTKQVQSVWDAASVSVAHDYSPFNPDGVAVGAWVRLRDSNYVPTRTYRDVGNDTFAPLLGGCAAVHETGEGCAFQIIVQPRTHPAYRKNVLHAIGQLKKGVPLRTVVRAGTVGIKDIMRSSHATSSDATKPVLVDESALKAIEAKRSKPNYTANIRAVASAPTELKARAILGGMIAGFSQFSAPDRNEFIVQTPKNVQSLIHAFVYRLFDEKQAAVLSVEELTSIFHFPTSFTAIPQVATLKFKEAPAPANLPNEGIVLGESRYHNDARPVRLTREDRRRHVYAIGQTGTGKSVLLNNLFSQDVVAGEGVCLIDPNGDLFSDVLSRIPRERAKDVVIFDPSDISRPIGLNMLEYDPAHPEHKTFIVNELLVIFNTLYDMKATGGPMFEQYMRNALQLLMDDPSEHATLVDLPRVLADKPFRMRLLSKCTNIIVKDFWEKEAEKAGGEASLVNMVPYITSKFNTFIVNDYVRPIIGQPTSTIQFRELMDSGKILLVNLSKGRIGELNAGLLGMIIVGKLTLAAFSRDDIAIDARRDFYCYIDEFQNFTTPSIATILSEARKYRLCLTVAHQFIGQLSEEIKNAIFGNVGSIVSLRVGPDDAAFLEKQFQPVFTAQNLINIDNLHAHVKLMVSGTVAQPFTMFIPFPEKGDAATGDAAREYSRLTYGRDRAEVEASIYDRLRPPAVAQI